MSASLRIEVAPADSRPRQPLNQLPIEVNRDQTHERDPRTERPPR